MVSDFFNQSEEMPPILHLQSPKRRFGFTILELLVASSVMMMILLVLVSASNQAAQLWGASQRQTQLRQQARTALDFIGSELKQVATSVASNDQFGPQFILNPISLPEACRHNDALFWQIPLPHPQASAMRGLAGIGYFVRVENNKFMLCRFFVEPSDPNYQLYEKSDWISGVVDAVAPATSSSNYRGLFLENVPGLWIKAYRIEEVQGVLQEVAYTPDTRQDGKLPSRVEISLAFMDTQGATKLGANFSISQILSLVHSATDAAEFQRNAPDGLRQSIGTARISISFADRNP